MVTGLSGAGKSSALRSLEDMGFFCIDNLPIDFLHSYLSHEKLIQKKNFKLAIHIDSRDIDFFKIFQKEVLKIRKKFPELRVLYLEASEEVIFRRFRETRRPHPLGTGKSLMRSIQHERKQYDRIRVEADFNIDTSHMNVHQLKQTLVEILGSAHHKPQLMLSVISFGYRFGIPQQCDLVMDVRFLPNPYFVPELKELSGLDLKVRNFVLKRKDTQIFIAQYKRLLEILLPKYLKEGKSYLGIAFGCTGGKHRSVSLAEYFKSYFEKKGYSVHLDHRDVNKK